MRTLLVALAFAMLLAPTAAADPVTECLAEERLVHWNGPGADGCVAIAENGDAHGTLVAFSLQGHATSSGVAASYERHATAPVAVSGCCIRPTWAPDPFCDFRLPFVPCFHE